MDKNEISRKKVLEVYDDAIITIDKYEAVLNKILEDSHKDEKAVVNLYYAINNFKMKLEEILEKGPKYVKAKG